MLVMEDDTYNQIHVWQAEESDLQQADDRDDEVKCLVIHFTAYE